jgi:hypothetical protein
VFQFTASQRVGTVEAVISRLRSGEIDMVSPCVVRTVCTPGVMECPPGGRHCDPSAEMVMPASNTYVSRSWFRR